MKRISLILLPGDTSHFLEALRRLGVVHIDWKASAGPEHDHIVHQYKSIQDAIGFLGKEPKVTEEDVPHDAARQVNELERQVRTVEETIFQWSKKVEFWKPWGDFDVSTVRRLEESGVYLQLYQALVAQQQLVERVERRVDLSRSKTTIRFAVASRTPESLEGFERVAWPEVNPSHKEKMLEQAQALRIKLQAKTREFARWIPGLKRQLASIADRLDWATARTNLESHEGLLYLTGWIPAPNVEEIKKFGQDLGVAVMVQDPTDRDQPPTKLKNSFFPNLMKPVFELLGITPGYNERDISWSFFVYFSIFFGMILGDGAYGAIIFAISCVLLVVAKVRTKRFPESWILLSWLGFCTMAWGAVTGTWFAIDYGALPSILQSLVLPAFNPTVVPQAAVANNVTVFCFTLGALQLGLASAWNFVQTAGKNFLKSISHLGWLGLTFGLYLLVLSMVSNAKLLEYFFPQPILSLLFQNVDGTSALPDWALPLIVSSYLLVLLMSFQEGKFWKGLGEGMANFLPTSLNAISAFADNISYIRLFAVGLAGYYIEVSFASMASGFGMSSFGGAVATVLVLVFGHTLNLTMGFLSVIVHGIRLNVLEFSNRLGMEWSGRAYAPFRSKIE